MRKTFSVLLVGTALMFASSAAHATLYSYSGIATLCTGTCASFASLDLGTELTGTLDINTTPSAAFGDADVLSAIFSVFNPALPVSGPVGDPVNDNPLLLNTGLGILASNGTSGSTDGANEIAGGQMLFQFLTPPFSSNGAFTIFDLSTGGAKVCLFFSTAGCIPGATEAVIFAGSFELVPEPATALLLATGLTALAVRRRRLH